MSLAVLPAALLILVHLHLLNFPSQPKEASQYDEHLFNPSMRGIGERIKTMEDISFFLVGKLEGQSAKKILPTYPCLRPSDTVAFRAALTKYLETQKHAAMQSATTDRIAAKGSVAIAWWWKDVIIRKSLLEECSGERFERLLLALSTHAVSKDIQKLPPFCPNPGPGPIQSLNSYAQAYMTTLTAFQRSRGAWESSALLLMRRGKELNLLQARLAHPEQSSQSKYDDLSTERLLALCESRLEDLRKIQWQGEEGQRALHALVKIAGLQHPLSQPSGSHAQVGRHADAQNVQPERQTADWKTTAPAPPLPIAAARHPANLRALKKPIFSTHTIPGPLQGGQTLDPAIAEPEHVSDYSLISDRLAAEARTQHMLHDALAQARRVGQEIAVQLEVLQTATRSPERAARHSHSSSTPFFTLNLTSGTSSAKTIGLNLESPPTRPVLSRFGIPSHPSENGLQKRVDIIRETLDPAWPPIREPSAAARTPLPRNVSRLPQPSSKGVPTSSVGSGDLAATGPSKGRTPSVPVDFEATAATATMLQHIKPSAVASTYNAAAAVGGMATKLQLRSKNEDGHREDQSPVEPSRKVSSRTVQITAPRPRKSVLAKGRARRSSAFAVRRTMLDDEVDQIVSAVQDDSSSSIELAAPDVGVGVAVNTPKAKTTRGTPLTPFSTILKSAPRPSFDIDSRVRAMDVPLPRFSLGGEELGLIYDDEEDEDAEGGSEGAESQAEGNSMTLADILLKADTSQLDLMGEDELMDESFEWE